MRANFHNDEHIDQAESCRHNNEEIACNDGFRMVTDKCHPALGRLLLPRLIRHASAHCARRNLNSELQQEIDAIRSSPHEGLLLTMLAISCRSSWGIRGRPARDFHFQNSRNPFRCHRIRVSGLTMVKACRHSKNVASSAMVKRTASVARLGLFFRSRYKASCFRRNRFSAASALRERSPVLNTVTRSSDTRREVNKNFESWGRFSMADESYMLKSQFSCQIEYLRSTIWQMRKLT